MAHDSVIETQPENEMEILNMSPKSLAAEYRLQYANHQKIATAYAAGTVSHASLVNSANALAQIANAYHVVKEEKSFGMN